MTKRKNTFKMLKDLRDDLLKHNRTCLDSIFSSKEKDLKRQGWYEGRADLTVILVNVINQIMDNYPEMERILNED